MTPGTVSRAVLFGGSLPLIEATYSGTSFSCPYVAGAVALYLAANPTATPAAVAAALASAAQTATVAGTNPAVSSGFPDTTSVSLFVANI